MSFVGEPYLADIFISYSHGSVRGETDSNFKQWSKGFWRELQREFEAHDDLDGLRIFFDSSDRLGNGIDPLVAFDTHLEEEAANAAVFMPLISPRYLKSDWCMRELAIWREAQEKRRLDTRGRLAPVVIWGTPPAGSEKWPDALKGIGMSQLIGFDFYDRRDAVRRPQPFGWPGWGERIRDERFYDPLLDLVGHLRPHLIEFKGIVAETGRRGGPARDKDARPTVYLHGREDARSEWFKAFEDLRTAGFRIWPDGIEPVEPDAGKRALIRDARIKAISNCDVLLVVGPQDNAAFGEEVTALGIDYRGRAIATAEKRGERGKRLPCAVVDMVSDPDLVRLRQAWAEDNRLGWFKLGDPTWVSRASEWLGAALQ